MVDRDTQTYHYPIADKLHHFCMDLDRTYLWLQSNTYNFNQEMTIFLPFSYTGSIVYSLVDRDVSEVLAIEARMYMIKKQNKSSIAKNYVSDDRAKEK